MKTTSIVSHSFIFITLLSLIFMSSCTKEELTNLPEADLSANLSLKSAEVPTLDNVECDLIAGQFINVGKVIYSHDATNIYVTYLTTDGWKLSELHLYVGDLEGLPTNKTAIQIGHFPFSAENLNQTTYTFTVPILNLPKDDETGYTIAVHAIVKNGLQEETAWSNCSAYKPLIAVKTFLSSGFWAASDGDRPFATLDPNLSWNWCYWLGTNIYEKGEEYLLQGLFYPTGDAGKVMVDDDGTNIEITVMAEEGLKLVDTYLYVGTLQGLKSYIPIGINCPSYTNFPMQIHTESPTHTFTIPILIKNSIAFTSQYDSKRWGWFSYYNF